MHVKLFFHPTQSPKIYFHEDVITRFDHESGDPGLPSGISVMRTINDPRNSFLQMILPGRANSQLSSGNQIALMTHVMPTTLQVTDLETFLFHTGVTSYPSPSSLKSFSKSDQVNSQGQSREYSLELYSQTN
jgi:hypothetical protein